MNPISAARPAAIVLATLALSGCYYTGPYGYVPYYAPVPATLSQREIPAAPASAASAASAPSAAAALPPTADDYAYAPAAVYAAPVYVPYPAYYPAYYPAWYGPPVTIGLGFWGHWGGGYRGGYWHRPWGGGHWGGGHWGGGHRH
ncbi:hypothetical protein [Burkholderia latens]|uniref:Putative lipoprotein n=1 Tax=Burkholderia latens TaxID=488446 RepID=A0A6H9SQZ4_9BURK|nr:hypothetical protein [Burkholderia latens]KAB0641367.1 hypothetical protein F7R21_15780 [Burkholderia latens]VWB71542.1 putative lipoprotein [Burkholderia latens]